VLSFTGTKGVNNKGFVAQMRTIPCEIYDEIVMLMQENLLVIYWLILTEERFAVLIPTPGGMLEMTSTICNAQRYVKVTLPLGEMLETTSTIRDVQRFASMTQPHTDQHVRIQRTNRGGIELQSSTLRKKYSVLTKVTVNSLTTAENCAIFWV
jgi:hypothetical protein